MRPPRGSAQAEETGAGKEEVELELLQATTLGPPSSAEELKERKRKSGGAGDERVSDERAVRLRNDHKAMCDKAELWWTIEWEAHQKERILQAPEADNDAERRAFLEAFEADDEKRCRDEALMSALLAYDEPTSPTSASESAEDMCRQPRDWQDIR